jgi:hypothetical protein
MSYEEEDTCLFTRTFENVLPFKAFMRRRIHVLYEGEDF